MAAILTFIPTLIRRAVAGRPGHTMIRVTEPALPLDHPGIKVAKAMMAELDTAGSNPS